MASKYAGLIRFTSGNIRSYPGTLPGNANGRPPSLSMFFALPVPNSSHAERTVVPSGIVTCHGCPSVSQLGKRRDHVDPVVALCLPKPHVILEARLRPHCPLAIVVVPLEPVRSRCPPRIAHDEEWRSIRCLQRMPILRRPQKSPSQRIVV